MVLKGSVAAVACFLLKLVMSRMISLSTNLLQLPKFVADSGDDEDAMSYFSRLADD